MALQTQNIRIKSIYISNVPIEMQETNLVNIIQLYWNPNVTRVDFVPIKKTFIANNLHNITNIKTAFVHFNDYITVNVSINNKIKFINNINFHQYGKNISLNTYVNLKPIPSTLLNIHQAIANIELLEKKIITQENDINNLKKNEINTNYNINKLWSFIKMY